MWHPQLNRWHSYTSQYADTIEYYTAVDDIEVYIVTLISGLSSHCHIISIDLAIGGLKIWQLTYDIFVQGEIFHLGIILRHGQVFFLAAPAQWEERCSGNLSLAIQQHAAIWCEDWLLFARFAAICQTRSAMHSTKVRYVVKAQLCIVD